MLETIGLFLLISGLIIGLGAVTVIDIHGFLGRKSGYWTESTIRTHKITKPLIWLGMLLVIIGGIIYYLLNPFSLNLVQTLIGVILVANGCFLTFWLSPRLVNLESQGKATKVLPDKWQRAIFVSFVISFFGWWSEVVLLTISLVRR